MSKTPEEMAEEYLEQDKVVCAAINRDAEDLVKDAFIAGYKAAQQWISVKDRLPNVEKTSRSLRRESSCVLIVSYDNVYVAHLCEDWSDRKHFIFEACNCNCRVFDMEIDAWKLDQVTHWMPLPEAPKEESDVR